jgi:hypothetical protein
MSKLTLKRKKAKLFEKTISESRKNKAIKIVLNSWTKLAFSKLNEKFISREKN